MSDRDIFAPRRAHSIEITAGGDTLEDLIEALHEITFDLASGQLTQRVSGGARLGYSAKYRHDPEMTHDRYMSEISDHIEKVIP